MSHTITVRLTEDLAKWLAGTAKRTGLPQGRIIREQLERMRAAEKQSFLKLAGSLSGAPELSSRKGFSRS
jgi:hypothetical protein